MRNVDKERDERGNLIIPAILTSDEISHEWEEIANQTKKPPKSMSISKEIIEELNKFYHEKCAYCESDATLEVEHYRPKNKIQGEKGHEGYYWLYYEWTNLLPACHDCNKIGTGKGTRFPIMDNKKRETKPQFESKTGKLNKKCCKPNDFPLKAEQPYLLHPEYDNPKEYFGFKINDQFIGINIVGTDKGGRGEETHKICDLNREPLRRNRQGYVIQPIIDHLRYALLDCKEENFDDEKIQKKLLKYFILFKENAMDTKLPYTLLHEFVIESAENFEKIILPYYEKEPQTQKTIGASFKLYKEFERLKKQ